ncbi:hypothetical protein O9992_14195 [Vibrio lentus]|nr:hypothetical protein [Vibrio lentus]
MVCFKKQQAELSCRLMKQTALAKATSNLEVLNQQLTNVQQQRKRSVKAKFRASGASRSSRN